MLVISATLASAAYLSTASASVNPIGRTVILSFMLNYSIAPD